MTKSEFLEQLNAGLSALPKDERDEHTRFYSEMIDDRLEEGLSESEAVAAIAGIGEVIARELAEARSVPLWIALFAAAFAVAVAVYASVWSVIVACWSVLAALAACALAGTLGGIPLCFTHGVWVGLAILGVGLLAAGIGGFTLYGCVKLTVLIARLTKAISLWCARQLSRIFKGGKK